MLIAAKTPAGLRLIAATTPKPPADCPTSRILSGLTMRSALRRPTTPRMSSAAALPAERKSGSAQGPGFSGQSPISP